MKILADASLPDLIPLFPEPFELSKYHSLEELKSLLPFADILLCRSTLKIDAQLLNQSQLKCVATASSGIDHIDVDYLNTKNITLFDAKGSNAHAVTDYVTSTLAWLEKNTPFSGKKVGIIGRGAVGSQVVNRLHSLGYQIISYDPYKRSEDNQHDYCSFDDLTECDLLCLHANLHNNLPYPSRDLINTHFLSRLKPGVAIINASRGGIVNEVDLLNAKCPIYYCADVYLNEPNINPAMIEFATLCTPHIAGHSIEAKRNAIVQLSHLLHAYFNLTSPAKQSSIVAPKFGHKINSAWQDRVLQRYNPHDETLVLKSETDKINTFLSLRKAHIHRHDFNSFTF